MPQFQVIVTQWPGFHPTLESIGTLISSLGTGTNTLWQGMWVLGGTVGTCQGTCCCPCQAGPRSGCSISPGWPARAALSYRVHTHTQTHMYAYT